MRYFKADLEGAIRIAIVESDDHDDTGGFDLGNEIQASDLPDNFGQWECYDRYSTGSATVVVMSEYGY